MWPFRLHDVEILIFKNFISRKRLLGLLFSFKLINLVLEEFNLHLIFVTQVTQVLWIVVNYQLGVRVHARLPFVLPLLWCLIVTNFWILHHWNWWSLGKILLLLIKVWLLAALVWRFLLIWLFPLSLVLVVSHFKLFFSIKLVLIDYN